MADIAAVAAALGLAAAAAANLGFPPTSGGFMTASEGAVAPQNMGLVGLRPARKVAPKSRACTLSGK